jgi:VanZ family protein
MSMSKISDRARRITSVSLLVSWALIIFLLSNEPSEASTTRSDVLLHTIQSFDFSFFQQATEFIVRKSAHFIAYLILGLLTFITARQCTTDVKRAIILSISFTFIYACTDEVHQLFIAGRSGQPRDVLIDTLGATVGVSIYCLVRSYAPHDRTNDSQTV